MRIFVSAAITLLVASAMPALAQSFEFTEPGGMSASDPWLATGNHGTAGQGLAGSAYDQQTTVIDGITVNEHTSDAVMTENNMAPMSLFGQDPYYVQPQGQLANTHTSKTIDANYERITERVPYGRTQTGLLAPLSVNPQSFEGGHTLGFGGPGPVTGPGLFYPQGANWTGADGSSLPPVGTGEPAVDVTPGGGYF